MINNKNLLVTGGTGTFGKAFISHILKNYKPKKVIVFSRDEMKQYEMGNHSDFKDHKNLRFFLGDVRDQERLSIAMDEVDYVIHAAALKQVPAAEYNPIEFIKTNIYGAENVIKSSVEKNVKNVIALSTDKAVHPANLYGATKLASDKLFVSANNMYGLDKTRFAITRYGNVLSSRGSVVPYFKSLIDSNNKYLPITDKKMTRFWITKEQAVSFVLDNLARMKGGEIYIPKLPSVRIVDLAKAMSPQMKIKVIGKRPGEKIHELMCPSDESNFTIEYKNHYVINSNLMFISNKRDISSLLIDARKEKGIPVSKNFEYNSGNNSHFLTVKEIKKLNDKIK